MWRSHNACLEIPLRQPITAVLRAQQLPSTNGGAAAGDAPIALHLLLQADAACSVVVTDAQLALQSGLQQHPAFPLQPQWLMPLELPAGGSAGVTFVLQRARGELWRGGLVEVGHTLATETHARGGLVEVGHT